MAGICELALREARNTGDDLEVARAELRRTYQMLLKATESIETFLGKESPLAASLRAVLQQATVARSATAAAADRNRTCVSWAEEAKAFVEVEMSALQRDKEFISQVVF